MGYPLPTDVIPSFNPPMWDKVIDTPTMTLAIAFTKSGQEKMFYRGWSDAIDNKEPRSTNQYYWNGYCSGIVDLRN